MQWASTVTCEPDFDDALAHAADRIGEDLGAVPDVVFCFASPHYADHYHRIPRVLTERLGGGLLFGCSASGVIGNSREIERDAGLAVTAAVLPQVELSAQYFDPESMPGLNAGSRAWRALLGEELGADAFVLMADPYSFPVEPFLRGLDLVCPEAKKIGGLASAARAPGENALFIGDQLYHQGLVCLSMRGNISLQTLVAQGCRPIGEPMFITRARDNLLIELDGMQPMRVLEQMYAGLSARERAVFGHSLFLGMVMQPSKTEYGHGDFLIRNVIGSDPDSGVLWIGADLEENQVVQFHLRDEETSARDLELVLSGLDDQRPAQGSLLFSCIGRGESLYGEPDHDARAFQRHVGDVPLGGFFCNGEIGPVQGRTYLHGYTSAFGVFRARHLT